MPSFIARLRGFSTNLCLGISAERTSTHISGRDITRLRGHVGKMCVCEREILFLQIFHACRLAFRLREDRLRVISTAKSSAKWTRQLLFRSNERTNWRNVETNRWNQRVDLWNRVASDKARSSMRRNNRGRTVVDSGRTEWNHVLRRHVPTFYHSMEQIHTRSIYI